MCIAQLVRDVNGDLWAPDVAAEAAPELLVAEPKPADSFESLDGRSWVRVYADGSVLDQFGHVYEHQPRAAAARRFEPAKLAA